MAGFTIKALNQQYTCIASIEDFDAFIDECEKKLKLCAAKSDMPFKAFFLFNRELSGEELIRFFDTVWKQHVVVQGIGERKMLNSMNIWDQPLYAGQSYDFEEDTLILGDIPNDTYITAHHNLYVVGELEGCIDLMHEDCECYCSSSNDAKIRIFDSSFQNLTFFTASRLYYKNHQVIISKLKEGFYGN